MIYIALVLWGAMMIAAAFYSEQRRHPAAKALAAYLIFVTVFSVTAFVIYGALILLLQALGRVALLSNPVLAAVFLLVVFVPAFLLARWQLKKPPARPHRP